MRAGSAAFSRAVDFAQPAMSNATSAGAPPPPPPFVFTRESRIRIDREGDVWHEGERVEHDGLRRGLLSWLARDEATGRYILRNTLDWCFITVDDAPIVVRAVGYPDRAGAPITLTLADGTTEPLDPATLWLDAEDVPYCTVRTFPARFARTAAFTLLEHARPAREGGAASSGYVLVLPGGAGEVPLPRSALHSAAR